MDDGEVACLCPPVGIHVGIDVAVGVQDELHDGPVWEPEPEKSLQGKQCLFSREAKGTAFPYETLRSVHVAV